MEFILQGLTCANCAAKIESSIRELYGVSYASVNFTTATLRVAIAGDNPGDLYEKISRIVHHHEPDALILEKTNQALADNGKTSRAKILLLMAGVFIFAAGMILERLFEINQYIPVFLFISAYLFLGGKVVIRAGRNITRGKFFDENFLMAVATIGAFAIGEHAEAVGVMLFYQTGELFQESAVRKSKKTIAALMDIRPYFANLLIDGQIKRVSPDSVQIGEMIVVKPGEKIPLDGEVTDGEALFDASALTGESVPRKASAADTVLSGCVNQNGVLTIKVTRIFSESTALKIIDLVENAAEKKAPVENFITKFARYYTPVVVGLAAIIAIIPPLMFGGAWFDWLNRGLIFLVISCPCALVISIPLGFFGGIGGASRMGVLIKGGNYLEALNDLDVAVFDKTGTLTKGVFKVTAILPANGFSNEKLLETAAKAEAFSNHPVALSILREYGKAVEKSTLTEYSEIAGYGVKVNAGGATILAGNQNLMGKMGVVFEEVRNTGTKVYVSADGIYAGCIVISDEIKPDGRDAIAALKTLGVRKTVMLTGDDPLIAEAIANELNIDEVYGGLLPQQKVEKLEMLNGQKRRNGKLAFVGDGINDAPVLAMADIGVAMGGLGSDAAIEAADVVLMTDEPSKLVDAVKIARFTKRVIWQNIIFALGVKALFLVFGAMGMANMWEAVFADVGVALLAIINATRVMNKRPGNF